MESDVTGEDIVPVVTFRRQPIRIDMQSQLVGTGRNVSDVNPLAIKVSAIKVTTVLGNTLMTSATAISEIQGNHTYT